MSNEFKKIRPSSNNVLVFDPSTKLPLPKNGKEVKIDSYWRRLLACGDVVFCEDNKKEDFKNKSKDLNSKK